MRLTLALVVVVGIAALVFSPACDSGGKKRSKQTTLFKLINELRSNASVPELIYAKDIAAVAQDYAEVFTVIREIPATYTVTLDNTTLNDRMTNGGVVFASCIETGWVDTTSSAADVAGGHLNQATLTSTSYTRVGIGYEAYTCVVCAVHHPVYIWIVDLAN